MVEEFDFTAFSHQDKVEGYLSSSLDYPENQRLLTSPNPHRCPIKIDLTGCRHSRDYEPTSRIINFSSGCKQSQEHNLGRLKAALLTNFGEQGRKSNY